MTLRMVAVVLVLGSVLTGCGKYYWQAEKRGLVEFRADSGQCIQEAKTKYGVSEGTYRNCMRAHGWRRVQTQYPSDLQFRGPEDEGEFSSPPDPLSARGPQPPERSEMILDCRNPSLSTTPEARARCR